MTTVRSGGGSDSGSGVIGGAHVVSLDLGVVVGISFDESITAADAPGGDLGIFMEFK